MGNDGSAGVKVNAISEDNTPGRRIHDPSHPLADGELCHPFQRERCGRMVNMISASRSYQNNVEVMNTAKTLLLKTLQMGQ
ncbi:hypothetical protein J4711_15020 [Staphylococcus epidermidis]|nr:hypothetical protein [Staphylococcus epidermidis]